MNEWTPAELGYFAGIIDSEGSFSLKNPGNHRFSGQLSVGNTDPRLMEWLRLKFGGRVFAEDRPNVKHKRVWRWYASAKDLDRILSAVTPYLILKRDRAELFVAYRKTLHRIGNPRKTDAAVKAERVRIHSELSLLNRRGVA